MKKIKRNCIVKDNRFALLNQPIDFQITNILENLRTYHCQDDLFLVVDSLLKNKKDYYNAMLNKTPEDVDFHLAQAINHFGHQTMQSFIDGVLNQGKAA